MTEILTDPTNLDAVLESDGQLLRQVLVLGGGETRDLHLPEDLTSSPRSSTWNRST